MCEECTRVSCSGCPFSVDGAEECDICELCGEPVFDGDAFVSDDACVCCACADGLTVDDLLKLGSMQDVVDLLEFFGFSRII